MSLSHGLEVLVVSSGIVHPPALGRLHLWNTLRALPGMTLRHVSSLEALGESGHSKPRAVVLYYHAKSISPSALQTLDGFARAGGGILAVHSATASFKQSPAYFDILGGRFVGHPPVSALRVQPTQPIDDVFGAVAPFEVRDEAYHHELAADLRVHFTARIGGDGAEAVPFVWTRRHGSGRVCYVGAGHCAGSLTHPSIQGILQTGLRWVCGLDGEVRT